MFFYLAFKRVRRQLPLHLMLLPCVILLLVFHYGPMIGIIIAFKKFIPSLGIFKSPFVGLDNFLYVFNMPDTMQIVWNTIFIAFMKIITGLIVPIIFAILLNEVTNGFFKRVVQTVVYMPHFMSWVILSGIIIDILSPSSGIANSLLKATGFEPVFFLGDERVFPYVLVITNIWKEFGWGTIIYLASITSIDPTQYEAAIIDGANRWKQTLYVTLPGMAPIIIVMTTLSMGNVLNAGFEQVFNLYSPIVYKTGDIIDTFVYRIGLLDAQYGVATAVGLFKSVVSFIFITTSYRLAYKYGDYRIF